MSLRNLRSFVEAFRCQSLSEAAHNLGLTQPAVSQHIASLEAQLGRKLFERQPRGVVATAFARDLAAQIGDGLDRAEAALATMRARSSDLSGVVHIAGPPELMAERIAPLMRDLVEAGLDARIHLGGKVSLYDALLKGEVDLAFTASEPSDAGLASTSIGTELLMAVASPAMAVRITSQPDLAAALKREPHVAYDMDRPLLRQWCATNQIDLDTRQPSVTAADLRLLRAMVETEVGWSVIPDYLCADAIRAGRLVPIDGPSPAPGNKLYLVWAKSSLRHPRVAYARDVVLSGLERFRSSLDPITRTR
ncbi:MAG: LysR family transcriptional regulator [Pseudomonadota bacterium]